MTGLGIMLTCGLGFVWLSPRQTGRWIAKVRIGYLAQLRSEGKS